MQFGVRAAPVSRPAPVAPDHRTRPRPYDGGGHRTNRHGNRHPSDDKVESRVVFCRCPQRRSVLGANARAV
jgi:hypothetical protein